MSPTEIKAKAYDQIIKLVSELSEFPTLIELSELVALVEGLEYVVSETITGQESQHQAYQRVMEEEA
jgi:hypothetical protein